MISLKKHVTDKHASFFKAASVAEKKSFIRGRQFHILVRITITMSPLTKLEIYGMQKTFHSNTLEPWYPQGRVSRAGPSLQCPNKHSCNYKIQRHCAITLI